MGRIEYDSILQEAVAARRAIVRFSPEKGMTSNQDLLSGGHERQPGFA
jgi:hypothetical protein